MICISDWSYGSTRPMGISKWLRIFLKRIHAHYIILGVIVCCAAFAEEFIDQIAKAQDEDAFKDFIAKSSLPEK